MLVKRVNSGRLSQLAYLVANLSEIVLFRTEIQHPPPEKKKKENEIFDVCARVILSNIFLRGRTIGRLYQPYRKKVRETIFEHVG